MATPAATSVTDSKTPEGLSAKFARWTALYAAFLFLAGWGYLRNYFHVYGIDLGWLEVGANETIAQGFSTLFGSGVWLSAVYLLIVVLSLLTEMFTRRYNKFVNCTVVLCLIVLFPITYQLARNAGIDQANIDRGERTGLPSLTFTSGTCNYRGKLVFIKGESFYVYSLAYLTKPASKPESCPFDLTGVTLDVPQLWVVRASDVKDVRIVHYLKEAKR